MIDDHEIKYLEFPIGMIMRHFASNLKEKFEYQEWFYDISKGKVIFKLYVRKDVNEIQNPER